jgi:hypothetical protein
MKKHILLTLLLLFFFSGVYAELPKECLDIPLDKAIQVLEGAETVEINGYIWQVNVQHKSSFMYIRKIDGTLSPHGPYPSNFYWEDYNLIRKMPPENITIRLNGEKKIEPDNFLSVCCYEVILAGTANPIAGFTLFDPHEIHPTSNNVINPENFQTAVVCRAVPCGGGQSPFVDHRVF